MAEVKYTLEMTAENAPKIDAINRIILGDTYSAESSVAAPDKVTKPAAKETAKAAAKPAAKEASGTTTADLKAAAKLAKADHGEEFASSVIEASGFKLGASLGRSLSAIDEGSYDEVIALWAAGPVPTEAASDEPLDDDDDFDDEDEDDVAEVSADAVKVALKALAKTDRTEAKRIMKDNGCEAMSKLDDCKPAQLVAMMKELV